MSNIESHRIISLIEQEFIRNAGAVRVSVFRLQYALINQLNAGIILRCVNGKANSIKRQHNTLELAEQKQSRREYDFEFPSLLFVEIHCQSFSPRGLACRLVNV